MCLMRGKQIIVIVGPSGSGKTTIGEELAKQGIPRLITTTSRNPRNGEKNGVDYYFRDISELNVDDFVEQTVYNNNQYGLTKEEVNSMLEKHDTVHVSLDQSGAEAVSKAYPDEACVVFVSITEKEMIRRMKKRGDSEQAIKDRIDFCRKTNELIPPAITDLVVINHDVQKAAQEIIDNVVNSN